MAHVNYHNAHLWADLDRCASLPDRADILVVGGGIAGCAAAWELAGQGADVVLVDRDELNAGASGRNTGSLHGQIQYPTFMLRDEAWAHSFIPALKLLAASIELWGGLSDSTAVDLEVHCAGGLLVAATDQQMRDVERKAKLEQAAGLPAEVLSRADLERVAPYVAEGMAGASLCPIEGKANPLLAAPALAAAATRRGARIVTHVEVLGIEHAASGYEIATSAGSISVRRVVICAGADCARLTRFVGVDLPIGGAAIQVCVTERVGPLVEHLVYYAGGTLTLKQSRTGTILIGGGWPAREAGPHGFAVDVQAARENMRVAVEVVPAVAGAQLLRSWAGICNATPDDLPVIGELPGVRGIVVATFPWLGFTAGPIIGRIAADLTLGRPAEYDLAPFAPERFA